MQGEGLHGVEVQVLLCPAVERSRTAGRTASCAQALNASCTGCGGHNSS